MSAVTLDITTVHLSPAGVAAQIHEHGGVLGLLRAGFHAEQIDDPYLAADWARLESAYGDVDPIVRQIESNLSPKNVRGINAVV